MMEDEKRGSSYEGIRLYNPNDYLTDESRTTWSEEKSESSLSSCPHCLSAHDQNPPQKLSSTMLLIPAKKGRFHLFEENEYTSCNSNETFSTGNSSFMSPKISNTTEFSRVDKVPQAQQTLKNFNYRNESFSSNVTSESAAFSASGTQMLSDESITKEVTFPATKHYDIYCSGKWSDKGCVVISKLEDINGNKRKIFNPIYRLGKLPSRFETKPRIPVFLQSAAYDSQFEIKLTEIDEIMRKPPLPKKMRMEESYETCRIFLNPQMENESIESFIEKQDSFKIIFPEKSIFPLNLSNENICGENRNSSSSETDQELDILPESNNEMFKYYQSCRLEQIENTTSQILESEDSPGMVKTKTSWDRIKSAVFEKAFSKLRFTTSKVYPEETSTKDESLFSANEILSSSTPSIKGKFSFKKLFKSLLKFGVSSNKELVSDNKAFKNYQILEEEVCVRYNDFDGNAVENESDETPSLESSINIDFISNKAMNTSSGIRSFPLSLPEIRANRGGSGSLREFYSSNATSKNTNASVTDSSEGESNKCVNNGMNLLSRTPIMDYLNEVKMSSGNSSATGQSSNKTLEDDDIFKTDTNLNETLANNSVTFSTSNEEIVDDSQLQNIVQDINNNNEYILDDCKKTDAIPDEQSLNINNIQQKETPNAITANRLSFLKGVFRIFHRKEPVIQVAHVSVKLDKEKKISFAADTPMKSKKGFFQRLFKKGDASLPTESSLTESKNNDSAISEPAKSFISQNTVNSSVLSNIEQEKMEEDPLKAKHVNSVSILRKKRLKLFAETQEFYQDSMTAYKHAITRMIGNNESSASPASFPIQSRIPSNVVAAASALKSGLIIENHSILGLGYKSTVSESVILPAMSKRKRRLHQGAILDDLLEDDVNENKEEKAEELKLKGILKNR